MKTFQQIFEMLSPAYRKALETFHAKHQKALELMPASLHYHHQWAGGYQTHVLEVCNNALTIHEHVPIPLAKYTLDDLIVAAYFHDVDKLFYRFALDRDPPTPKQVEYAKALGITISPNECKTSISKKIELKRAGQPINESEMPFFVYRTDVPSFTPAAMVCRICYENGIPLSDQALHAIQWHEGGWSPGMNSHVKLESLAALIHAADLLSAFGQNGQTPRNL
jgi:hypothetical protein